MAPRIQGPSSGEDGSRHRRSLLHIPMEAAHSEPKSSLMSDVDFPGPIHPNTEIKQAIDAMTRILHEERSGRQPK